MVEIAHLRELTWQRFALDEKARVIQAAEYERRLEVLNNDRAEARLKEITFIGREQYDIFVRDMDRRAETLATATRTIADDLGNRIRAVESRTASIFAYGAGMGFALTILIFALNYFRK